MTSRLALALPFAALASTACANPIIDAVFAALPAGCETDEHCPDGRTCNVALGTCGGTPSCETDADCSGSTCNTATGFCNIDTTSCIDESACNGNPCINSICLTEAEAVDVRTEDVLVTTQEDWNAIQSATTFFGDIYVGSDSGYDPDATAIVLEGDVALPSLIRLMGSLYFYGQPAVTRISLPQLTVLDDYIEIEGTTGLVELDLPELSTVPSLIYTPVAGSIEVTIENATAFRTLSAPKLSNIGWITFEITNAEGAEIEDGSADFSSLTTLGNLDIFGTGSIKTLSMPELTEIKGRVYGNFATGVEHLDMPKLREVANPEHDGNEDFYFYQSDLVTLSLPALEIVRIMELEGNPRLETIDLPAFTQVRQSATITNNAVLTAIEMPALNSVGNSLYITNNVMLDACIAQEIADCGAAPVSVDLTGNNGDPAACANADGECNPL